MQRLSLHNAKNYEMIENVRYSIYNFWRILNWLNVDAQYFVYYLWLQTLFQYWQFKYDIIIIHTDL